MTRYDEIVEQHRSFSGDIPFIFKRAGRDKLLVMIGTHNCKGVFPSLVTLFDDTNNGFDLLFIAEEGNTYYQGGDQGAAYFQLIRDSVAGYAPEKVVFFGASMAGYCALKWALMLNGNAVVSNPQLDLQATAPLAWHELRQTIGRAAGAEAITAQTGPDARSALVTLWSKHPMDIANFALFLDLVRQRANLSVSMDQNPETAHSYLITSYRHFQALLQRALDLRAHSVATFVPPKK